MAEKVTLNTPNYTDVSTTSATIQCSATGWVYPEDHGTSTPSGDDKNGSITSIEYKDTVWSWTFNDGGSSDIKEPLYTFTGLAPGMKQELSGTLTASCTKVETVESWYTKPVPTGEKDENGNPIMKDQLFKNEPQVTPTSYSLGSAKGTVLVYTKPAEFSWPNMIQDQTIQDKINGLSADKWNELCTKIAQRANWIAQDDEKVTFAEVSSNQVITADIYNEAATQLDLPTVEAKKTLIKASHFTVLSDAVNA